MRIYVLKIRKKKGFIRIWRTVMEGTLQDCANAQWGYDLNEYDSQVVFLREE